MKKFQELRRDCGFVIRSRTLKKLWKMTRLTTLLILLGMGLAFASEKQCRKIEAGLHRLGESLCAASL